MLHRRAFIAAALALTSTGRAAAQAPSTSDWSEADAIVARIRPPSFPDHEVSIEDHGARTEAPAHEAVQAAIEACATAGGGRVVVPAGLWRMNGPVHLRSNVELHLERGATLRFGKPGEIELPLVLTRWEGTEAYNFSPLVYARDCENVAITGEGVFDGQGRDGFHRWRGRQGRDKAMLRSMGARGVPVEQRRFGPGHFLRPAFVEFFECRNILIDGPRFVDSPFWTIHPIYSRNITVRNVGVVSKHLNSDGVDPDSCEDVLIEHCRFDVCDDCVAIKSGRDQDGWRVARPTRNVVVRDCDMSTQIAAAVAIGSEMSGGASNIFAERLRVRQAEHAIYFKGNRDRGGTIEAVRMRDIQVASSMTLINFTTDYHGAGSGGTPPIYKDFVVERVTCGNTGRALHIVGVRGAPVADVLIRDVTVASAALPELIAYTRDLRLDQVRVNGRFLFGGVRGSHA